LTPAELLENILKKYSSCVSYKDSGTATCGDSSVRFSTSFARPSRFLFECTNLSTNKTIIVRGNSLKSQIFVKGNWKDQKSLDYALTIASGASLGISQFIGQLLLRKPSESELLELKPYDYKTLEGGRIVISSNPQHSLRTELLTVNADDLTIVNRESVLKSAVLDGLATILPELRENNPKMASQLELAMDARSESKSTKTETNIESAIFNSMKESDFQELDAW